MLYPGESIMVRQKNLIAGIASCLTLSIPTVSLAAYIPPSDQVPPKTRGTIAARRSDCNANKFEDKFQETNHSAYLTALAPESYMGKTTSTHPTFAWFIDKSVAVPLQFSLYEHETTTKNLKPQPLFTKTLDSVPGIMKLTLPQDTPGLSMGKTYAWQVVLLCSTQSPSQNSWIRRPFQISGVSPLLGQMIGATDDPVKKMNLYAEAGLWYDALNVALSANASPQINRSMSALLNNLANLEKQKEPKDAPVATLFSEALREVAAANLNR